MDLVVIAPAFDLTSIATLLIAVGVAVMWAGRPAAASAAGAASSHGLPALPSLSYLLQKLRRQAVAAGDAVIALLPLAEGRPAQSLPVLVRVVTTAPAVPRARSANRKGARASRRERHAARPVVAAPSPRITLDQQWCHIETRVARTMTATAEAARLQARAVDQLDAADYALIKLRAELAGVMKSAAPAARAATARPALSQRPAADAPLPLAA